MLISTRVGARIMKTVGRQWPQLPIVIWPHSRRVKSLVDSAQHSSAPGHSVLMWVYHAPHHVQSVGLSLSSDWRCTMYHTHFWCSKGCSLATCALLRHKVPHKWDASRDTVFFVKRLHKFRKDKMRGAERSSSLVPHSVYRSEVIHNCVIRWGWRAKRYETSLLDGEPCYACHDFFAVLFYVDTMLNYTGCNKVEISKTIAF